MDATHVIVLELIVYVTLEQDSVAVPETLKAARVILALNFIGILPKQTDASLAIAVRPVQQMVDVTQHLVNVNAAVVLKGENVIHVHLGINNSPLKDVNNATVLAKEVWAMCAIQHLVSVHVKTTQLGCYVISAKLVPITWTKLTKMAALIVIVWVLQKPVLWLLGIELELKVTLLIGLLVVEIRQLDL